MKRIEVSVVCAWPDQVWRHSLQLAEGGTVADVLAQLPWADITGLDAQTVKTGIFGRLVGPDEVLRQGDRIELCRPLQIDPKQVRRERAERERPLPSGRR